MSIASRLRNPKRPTTNARKNVKAYAARDKNRVDTVTRFRGDRGMIQERIESLPAAFNLTAGHRDLGLIPKNRRHGQRLGRGGILKGAFGGMTKAKRRERLDARKASLVVPV